MPLTTQKKVKGEERLEPSNHKSKLCKNTSGHLAHEKSGRHNSNEMFLQHAFIQICYKHNAQKVKSTH